ncbi:MAG: hypothetical protein WKG01_17925 [Kofleriaceae bacterium]
MALEQIGAPATAAVDPDWWTELGETLLAKGEAPAVVTRLTPVAAQLPTAGPIRVVLGAAQLATQQPELAMTTLVEAETIASTPRGRKLLVEALGAVAADKLATDPAEAETLLARADAIEGNPTIWRNLGAARLALDRPADAALVLDRAIKVDPSPVTLLLAARAKALTGEVIEARPLYERAMTAPERAIEVSIDWAASELATGDPALGVAALEKTAPLAKGNATQDGTRSGAPCRRRRGAAGERQPRGRSARAVGQGRPDVGREVRSRARGGRRRRGRSALSALRAISGQACPFPPPADTQAAAILIAFTEGLTARNPQRQTRALDRLTALVGKSSGPAAALLSTSLRVVALEAARDAAGSGRVALVRKFLHIARAANARVGTDDVAHGLAVLDLLEGRTDVAIVALDKVSAKIPEAYVNLGIAFEKKGDPLRALDAWRKARKAGVRFAPLADWIESKERIYGAAP